MQRGTAPSRVAARDQPPLANIAALIDNGGQITLGALRPIACAAIANDEENCLAMLQRKSGETLQQLLERLDTAIELAWTTGQFTDEINVRPPRIKPR
ncbi:MAG: hypothetical protein EPO23_14975 [Xanthobacteraceae bacterium]|nr:MAG: hypothetical protein EPO23_14975 [Xanthobacteraceae bacterium]